MLRLHSESTSSKHRRQCHTLHHKTTTPKNLTQACTLKNYSLPQSHTESQDVRTTPFSKESPPKSQKIANSRRTFEPRRHNRRPQTRPRTLTQRQNTTDSTLTGFQQQPNSFRTMSTPNSTEFRRKSVESPISHPFPTQNTL